MKNNIRVVMAEARVTSKKLAPLIGVDDVAMSFILNGKVLPTPESFQLMCKALSCKPSDLYEASDVRLISSDPVSEANQGTKPAATGNGLDHEHAEGSVRLYFWVDGEEKERLLAACKALGYRSTTEWVREMMRSTVSKCQSNCL